MISFTQDQREALCVRARRHPQLIEKMKESVREIFESPLLVPETGIANWQLYYYCPKCSVPLLFEWEQEKAHSCPQCNEIYLGEPYDSSWWGHVNSTNYNAAHTMGLLYIMTQEEAYARKAVDLLLTYTKHYPNYQVHGDIPYNGPGRSGAQTLDEANFQRNLAITFDLVQETMTCQERACVRDNMLLEGAQFLMKHRRNQLHNHEVIISSAIAIIGLIFDRKDMIDFALYAPYGIIYQLENGMLENGMWFEGSFGYHFYALTSFLAYEKFALNTPYSNIHHPNYEAMMAMAVDYLQPDGELPMMGDTTFGHLGSIPPLYEFAYREIRNTRMLHMLHIYYQKHERTSLDAVVYGVGNLPPYVKEDAPALLHPSIGHSGHIILRSPNDRYMLIKCDPYGGEHDHYDRLGIDYFALGERVAPDIGTTGYGATLHYDYYKNTGSHNTVVIGEENQSPACAMLKSLEQKDDVTTVQVQVDWRAPYQMPDSFTIVQWDENAYKTVKMIRKIAWTPLYFVEAFYVEGVKDSRSIDWVMHVDGIHQCELAGKAVENFSSKKPYKHLTQVRCMEVGQEPINTYVQGAVTTSIYSMNDDVQMYIGKGPHNPSYRQINYLIERTYGEETVFAHIIESYHGEPQVKNAKFERHGGGVRVYVTEKDDSIRIFDL